MKLKLYNYFKCFVKSNIFVRLSKVLWQYFQKITTFELKLFIIINNFNSKVSISSKINFNYFFCNRVIRLLINYSNL